MGRMLRFDLVTKHRYPPIRFPILTQNLKICSLVLEFCTAMEKESFIVRHLNCASNYQIKTMARLACVYVCCFEWVGGGGGGGGCIILSNLAI